jgi:hypothetical protein
VAGQGCQGAGDSLASNRVNREPVLQSPEPVVDGADEGPRGCLGPVQLPAIGDIRLAVLGGLRWLVTPASSSRSWPAAPASRSSPDWALHRPGPRPLVHFRGRSSPARRRGKIKFAAENRAEHFNQALARLWLASLLNVSRILTAGTKALLASPGSTAMSAIATPAACEITAAAQPVIVSALGRTTTGDNGGGRQPAAVKACVKAAASRTARPRA